jgi:hypothetical protein
MEEHNLEWLKTPPDFSKDSEGLKNALEVL